MNTFSKDWLIEKMKDWLSILYDEEKADNTLKRYRINITSFISFVSDKPIQKDTIRAFRDKISTVDNYVPNTANNYLIAVNKFLKFLDYKDLCIKVIKVQRKTSIDDYMDYTDYHRLLRCSLNKNFVRDYLIMRVFGETGARAAELKFFTVEALDSTIAVKNKGKFREIPVHRGLLTALRKYCRENHITHGYIFPGRIPDTPLHESSVRKLVKKAAGRARVKKEKVHPHSFRHYFAVRYLEAYPEDIVILADILGHESVETTRIYTKLSNIQKEKRLRGVKF